jgi:DNA-binding NtrC family response regulator
MTKPLLLIEDTPSLQLVYESVLKNAGHKVSSVGTAADGLDIFKKQRPGIVLLDMMLPDRDGLDLMTECLTINPDAQFIVITANGSINRAVAAMRAGAFEFLVKPFNEQRFLHAIDTALAASPGPEAPQTGITPGFGGFVGSSQIMQDVYGKINSVSNSMATVFITGESGTGKEICAQALHDHSNRSKGPFVPLNCGAIPTDLLESEVFGHLKGSFTGAISDKPGAAAIADGGTLFLDEICEMDLGLQTKLLRFLQTSSIQPVGSPHAKKVNVRIVCATNRDPAEEVRCGRFREDLYYRLYVVPIHLPPLRTRGDDVIEVAKVGLPRYAGIEGKSFKTLAPDVQDLFRQHPWPGNIRQLMNILRSVVVMNDGPVLTAAMLPGDILGPAATPPPRTRPGSVPAVQNPLDTLVGKTLAEIERLVIGETIASVNGSIPKAARILDLSPSTLYRKRDAWLEQDAKAANIAAPDSPPKL